MATRGVVPSPYGRRKNLQARWGPGQVARHDRDRECVEMRHAGHDWDTVVERLGYASAGHARDRYKLFLERLPPREGVEEQREIELARLDRLLVALEPKLAANDVRAVEVAIKLSERRARMAGYDTPVKTQLTVINDDLALELVAEWRAALEQKRQKALDAGITADIIDGVVVDQKQVE